jgi:hypothetical protein
LPRPEQQITPSNCFDTRRILEPLRGHGLGEAAPGVKHDEVTPPPNPTVVRLRSERFTEICMVRAQRG